MAESQKVALVAKTRISMGGGVARIVEVGEPFELEAEAAGALVKAGEAETVEAVAQAKTDAADARVKRDELLLAGFGEMKAEEAISAIDALDVEKDSGILLELAQIEASREKPRTTVLAAFGRKSIEV